MKRTQVKKSDNFFTCLISPIICWHVTCLLRHPVRLMNEWQRLHYSQALKFSGTMAAEIFRNSKTDRDVSNFLEGEENQNTKRKTGSYVFSGFGTSGVSRGWERNFFRVFGRVPDKISSVDEEKVINWEFCKFKVIPIVCFAMIRHIFSSFVLKANCAHICMRWSRCWQKLLTVDGSSLECYPSPLGESQN